MDALGIFTGVCFMMAIVGWTMYFLETRISAEFERQRDDVTALAEKSIESVKNAADQLREINNRGEI